MKTNNKFTRILQYALVIALWMCFGDIDIAHARGGYSAGGSGGSGSGGGHHTLPGGAFVPSTPQSVYSLLQALAILLLVLLPIVFYREIANLIRFWNQEFTVDPELLKFKQHSSGQYVPFARIDPWATLGH
jgi:hypothetical protein